MKFNEPCAEIVEVNANNLQSAIERAEKGGYGVTPDQAEWRRFVSDYQIDLGQIDQFILNVDPCARMVIITKGLMTGLFLHSRVTLQAYHYVLNPDGQNIAPLDVYPDVDVPPYDLVISYARSDLPIARNIFTLLDERFKVYFLDVDTVEDDLIWQIRSHYTTFFAEVRGGKQVSK